MYFRESYQNELDSELRIIEKNFNSITYNRY